MQLSLNDAISLLAPFKGTTQASLKELVKGTGSLSFTRATTATRVDPATGLIAAVASGDLREDDREYMNQAKYSETFDVGPWYKPLSDGTASFTVTNNYAIAPNGKQVASRFQINRGSAGDAYALLGIDGVIDGKRHVKSIWMKSNTGSNQNVLLYDSGDANSIVCVVTPTWQRFVLGNGAAQAKNSNLTIGCRTAGAEYYRGGDAVLDILAWGAQLETGTSATRYRKAGAAVNYRPKGILIEAQRTNLALNSGNPYLWADHNTPAAVQNYGTAPDGTTTSTQITDNLAGDIEGKAQTFISIPADTLPYCWSCFVKAGSSQGASVVFSFSGEAVRGVTIHFSTATVMKYTSGGGDPIAWGAIPYANGWWRLWASQLNVSKTAVAVYAVSYLPDLSDQGNLEIWGGQLEQGSFPSSYIPTTSGSVTRNADVLTVPISGNIANTGSAYVEADTISNDSFCLILHCPGDGYPLFMTYNSVGYYGGIWDGTTNNNTPENHDREKIYKYVGRWGSGGRAVKSNISAIASAGYDGTMVGGGADMYIGSFGGSVFFQFGHIRNLAIFNRLLTDAEMTALAL